ncbi:hypothetical protein STAFG_5918 [Streptomyces afghaniensis 772]|uniref:DUF3291 domain-containing protein n=1 Tax=Streptomyces afghaniensis 772 TaxID=1283301 RepID=S4NF64_9ACTN|nr:MULTISPECIES: hypothetical protein [Streptomyces]EPJ37049.1 hypothetical protein STAFG_5918 [Streptomyces afghaniensis 772]UOB11938.1 hypothetical protein MQE23_24030 [Streptomyces sp. HP-A2021]
MLRSRWCRGPAGGRLGDRAAARGVGSGARGRPSGPLIVSVTDFTSDAYRDLPGIARRGFALRRRWPHLDGAVGMWLWTMPSARRCGSVAVWTGRRALAEFVRLPEHVAIMDQYRRRGTIRSVILEYESLDAARIRRDAEAWLMSDDHRRDVRETPRRMT